MMIHGSTGTASTAWWVSETVSGTWWHCGYRETNRCDSQAAYSWTWSKPGCKPYPSPTGTYIWTPESSNQGTQHPAKMMRELTSFQQLANNDKKMFLEWLSRCLAINLLRSCSGLRWFITTELLNWPQIVCAMQRKDKQVWSQISHWYQKAEHFSCSTTLCCHFRRAAWPWLPVEPWGRIVRHAQ